jgi:hypothetical protein
MKSNNGISRSNNLLFEPMMMDDEPAWIFLNYSIRPQNGMVMCSKGLSLWAQCGSIGAPSSSFWKLLRTDAMVHVWNVMSTKRYQDNAKFLVCSILWFSDVWLTGGRHLIGPWKSFLAFPSTRVTVSLFRTQERWVDVKDSLVIMVIIICKHINYITHTTHVYAYIYVLCLKLFGKWFQMCKYVCILHIYLYILIYAYVYIYMYIYIFVCVCIHMCAYNHVYTSKSKE